MTRGAKRRGSIFGGLLLILLGLIFLLAIYDPGLRLGHLFAVYWPVLLILWGGAKVFDYFMAQRAGQARPPILSGGEAVLIVILGIVLAGFITAGWLRDHRNNFNFDVPEFGSSYTQSESLPRQTLPADAKLAIEIPRGDIAVHGRAGNDLLVTTDKTIRGLNHKFADRALQNSNVSLVETGGVYHIWPRFGAGSRPGASLNLKVQAPASTNIIARTAHGDIRIDGITGDAQASTGSGDVELQNSGGSVTAALNHGDARIAGATGNVHVTGRGGDVDISNVGGDVALDGSFDGSIRVSNVKQTVHSASRWSQITIAQLPGALEADLGDIKISGAGGPVSIMTHNADIDVADVAGPLNIADTHGDVKVAFANPPSGDINIRNDSGDVDVTLPANSSFEIAAISRSGEVQSDFGGAVLVSNRNASGEMTGRAGAAGGPRITIATTYGTIHLHKSSSNQ